MNFLAQGPALTACLVTQGPYLSTCQWSRAAREGMLPRHFKSMMPPRTSWHARMPCADGVFYLLALTH